ncbi:MAG: Mov34/MPN/PAD-1 family protein [Candidatus Lokiarchaeota archaeon]|nr:Mov34/MPN/PAD-1 family protein [Candidatus Lokiarchaeota archaeon]
MKVEKDIILFVNLEVLDEIKQCVKKAYPNEACGLIFGTILEQKKSNSENDYSYHYCGYKFECFESTHKSPVAFLMDDYNKLIEISRTYSKEYNYQLLSIFHSHPGSVYPSGVDIPYIEGYYKSGVSKFKHLIWTIMNASNEELNGFIYIFDELKQISVKIRKL